MPLKANCQLEGYGSGEGLEDKSISDKRATLCKPHEEGTLQSKLAGSEFKLIWGKIATLWIRISLKHGLCCFEAPTFSLEDAYKAG